MTEQRGQRRQSHQPIANQKMGPEIKNLRQDLRRDLRQVSFQSKARASVETAIATVFARLDPA